MRRASSGISKKTVLAPLFVGVTLMIMSCAGDDPIPPSNDPTLSSVSVSGGNAVTAGQTVQLSAIANFSNNTTQNVTNTAAWESSNTGVATVSPAGLVTGVTAGSADIRARFQNVTGTAAMQVSAAPIVNPMAAFTVAGTARGVDACQLLSSGDIDCRFDGSASTGGTGGAVTQWTWRFDVGPNSGGPFTVTNPIFDPNTGCNYFNIRPSATGQGFTQMVVKLIVRNAAGVQSAEVVNNNVRLFPQNQCGFGF